MPRQGGVAGPPPAKRARCPGGSPYQIFQNQQEAAFKRLATPEELTARGRLTKDAYEQSRKRIKDAWAGMTEEERKPFQELYNARLQERRGQAAAAASSASQALDIHDPVSASPQDRRSHWAVGTNGSTVDPAFVQEFFASGGRMPSMADVYDPTEFRSEAPAEPAGELLGQDIVIHGCPLQDKNICRNHPDKQPMDIVCSALRRLVQVAGKPLARSGDLLVMCESLGKPLSQPYAGRTSTDWT